MRPQQTEYVAVFGPQQKGNIALELAYRRDFRNEFAGF
jgi:hypothetical protein